MTKEEKKIYDKKRYELNKDVIKARNKKHSEKYNRENKEKKRIDAKKR